MRLNRHGIQTANNQQHVSTPPDLSPLFAFLTRRRRRLQLASPEIRPIGTLASSWLSRFLATAHIPGTKNLTTSPTQGYALNNGLYQSICGQANACHEILPPVLGSLVESFGTFQNAYFRAKLAVHCIGPSCLGTPASCAACLSAREPSRGTYTS